MPGASAARSVSPHPQSKTLAAQKRANLRARGEGRENQGKDSIFSGGEWGATWPKTAALMRRRIPLRNKAEVVISKAVRCSMERFRGPGASDPRH